MAVSGEPIIGSRIIRKLDRYSNAVEEISSHVKIGLIEISSIVVGHFIVDILL